MNKIKGSIFDGDWNIAEAILHSVSKRFPKIKFVVYEL
jgi:hypothetical protein